MLCLPGAGCGGTARFTTAGAVFQMTSSYTITSSLILDASGLSRPVTILAANQQNHFILTQASVRMLPHLRHPLPSSPA